MVETGSDDDSLIQVPGLNRATKQVDCVLNLVTEGRPVRLVCSTFGVARSHIAAMRIRPADWSDRRKAMI